MVRQPLFHFLLASCTGPDVASDCNEEEERAGYWRWQDGPDAGCIDAASPLAAVCSDRSLTHGYSCPTTFEELWNVLDDTGYGDFNNLRRFVARAERVGIAGVCIEDKRFPKTNSFLERSRQQLAPLGRQARFA